MKWTVLLPRDATELRSEMRMAIDARFLCSPVVPRPPVVDEPAQVGGAGARLPVVDAPDRAEVIASQAGARCRSSRVACGTLDLKGLDAHCASSLRALDRRRTASAERKNATTSLRIQLRLLERREVTAARHLRPPLHVERALGELRGRNASDVLGEERQRHGPIDPCRPASATASARRRGRLNIDEAMVRVTQYSMMFVSSSSLLKLFSRSLGESAQE